MMAFWKIGDLTSLKAPPVGAPALLVPVYGRAKWAPLAYRLIIRWLLNTGDITESTP